MYNAYVPSNIEIDAHIFVGFFFSLLILNAAAIGVSPHHVIQHTHLSLVSMSLIRRMVENPMMVMPSFSVIFKVRDLSGVSPPIPFSQSEKN